MLRKITLIAALAALLVIPATESFARNGDGGRHGGGIHMGGGTRMGAVRAHGFRGASFGRPVFHGRPYAGFGRPVYAHRGGYFPRHRAFVRPYPRFYGGFYGSCWRWRPTPFGWRRVWVCGYPYAYSWPYRYVW